MLSLEQVGSYEWQFVYPEAYEELMEEFHQGVELLEGGRLKKAERIFRQTLAQMPDHLDALHHLALVLDEQGRKAIARTVWEEAVRIGRAAFPAGFDPGRDRLEWGWLDNRPFLRCLQAWRWRTGRLETPTGPWASTGTSWLSIRATPKASEASWLRRCSS